ncbi:MAG: hypothetical protein ACP5JH_05115 [Bacteroidota bacterium]
MKVIVALVFLSGVAFAQVQDSSPVPGRKSATGNFIDSSILDKLKNRIVVADDGVYLDPFHKYYIRIVKPDTTLNYAMLYSKPDLSKIERMPMVPYHEWAPFQPRGMKPAPKPRRFPELPVPRHDP